MKITHSGRRSRQETQVPLYHYQSSAPPPISSGHHRSSPLHIHHNTVAATLKSSPRYQILPRYPDPGSRYHPGTRSYPGTLTPGPGTTPVPDPTPHLPALKLVVPARSLAHHTRLMAARHSHPQKAARWRHGLPVSPCPTPWIH